jgi:hypothetical protein
MTNRSSAQEEELTRRKSQPRCFSWPRCPINLSSPARIVITMQRCNYSGSPSSFQTVRQCSMNSWQNYIHALCERISVYT